MMWCYKTYIRKEGTYFTKDHDKPHGNSRIAAGNPDDRCHDGSGNHRKKPMRADALPAFFPWACMAMEKLSVDTGASVETVRNRMTTIA